MVGDGDILRTLRVEKEYYKDDLYKICVPHFNTLRKIC